MPRRTVQIRVGGRHHQHVFDLAIQPHQTPDFALVRFCDHTDDIEDVLGLSLAQSMLVPGDAVGNIKTTLASEPIQLPVRFLKRRELGVCHWRLAILLSLGVKLQAVDNLRIEVNVRLDLRV